MCGQSVSVSVSLRQGHNKENNKKIWRLRDSNSDLRVPRRTRYPLDYAILDLMCAKSRLYKDAINPYADVFCGA